MREFAEAFKGAGWQQRGGRCPQTACLSQDIFSQALSFLQCPRGFPAVFPQCFRSIPALFRQYSRTNPRFPQHSQIISAVFPQCSSTARAVFPQGSRSTAARFLQYSRSAPLEKSAWSLFSDSLPFSRYLFSGAFLPAVLSQCSRSPSTVFPQRLRFISAVFPQCPHQSVS